MQLLTLFAQEAPSPDGAAAGFLGGGIAFIVCIAVVGILSLALFIWALVDALQNPALDGTMKLVWILVIIFTSPIGAIVYLVVGRKK